MLVSMSGISREMSASNALIGMPGKAAWVPGGATRTLTEAERTLGEATRTMGEATLTGESGGDPGADNSESEVEGDLLEFAEPTAIALAREEEAKGVRLWPCRRRECD